MSIGAWAIGRARLILFSVVLLALSGVWAYGELGKLEDPDFTIHTALVHVEYPGARAERVEAEVTEVLERHIQQLGELEEIESVSRDGNAIIYVHVQERYTGQRLRQIWDELNKKVQRAAAELPDSTRGPFVDDDYGDVFGLLYAVTGDGFTQREIDDYADELRRELLRVPGVARSELFGRQGERIFVEISRERIAALGLHPGQIVQALQRQNVVAPGGAIDLDDNRVGLFVSGVFDTVEDVQSVSVRNPETDERIYLRDIANVHRGYADPPERILRHDGEPGIALGIVPDPGTNVAELGKRIEERLEQLTAERPVGMEIHTVNDQPRDVEAAVNEFSTNLATAVAIVVAVLLVALGWRTGVIVGSGVPLTIISTFLVMYFIGIDLHRVSLGALIIVLGMLVDNAIVVAELMMTRIQRGVDRARAAREAVSETAGPLLIGTLIAALAFSPISMTPTAVGEFTRSLFWVVAIALAFSWLLAITLTTVLAYRYLPEPRGGQGEDPHATIYHRIYRRVLETMLRHRWKTVVATLLVLVCSAAAFTLVPRIFFPPADRDQLLIDHWRSEGTRIESVADDTRRIEQFLAQHPKVVSATSFIGEGTPRFYLPMIPELPNPAYAQILVQTKPDSDLEAIIADIDNWLSGRFPDAQPRVRPMQLGDPVRYPLELRVSGLGDHQQLRNVADELRDWIDADTDTVRARHNWRQKAISLDVEVDQERARAAGLSTAEIAETLEMAYADGPIGVLIDGDRRLPIHWRLPETERGDISRLETLNIWPQNGEGSVPLRQVAELQASWEERSIWRQDRVPTITIQADLRPGATSEGVVARLDSELGEHDLPPGIELEWGGEHEASWEARTSVLAQVPLVLAAIALLLVAQFNSLRDASIVALTVPLALVGVVVGLLAFQQPFGFIALLGAMSLAGMLIRNAVVLIDQIRLLRSEQYTAWQAVVEACVSRLRPVLLTAATTILGMLPLALSGPFWAPMAIAVMTGLAFGTVLILGVAPALYVLFHGIYEDDSPQQNTADGTADGSTASRDGSTSPA
ncbi:efflux RND transporter permease subunit [Halorhodospira halochloris]|uniref:efflux RND transporter permease subunit n=1 Tax=Halorhodospira halochloris TaxID=1052 RepID=UPI001EE99BDE|nr:efflux RND transporter permease subunit [Halorhodospira halochloris]